MDELWKEYKDWFEKSELNHAEPNDEEHGTAGENSSKQLKRISTMTVITVRDHLVLHLSVRYEIFSMYKISKARGRGARLSSSARGFDRLHRPLCPGWRWSHPICQSEASPEAQVQLPASTVPARMEEGARKRRRMANKIYRDSQYEL